jgi:hypothetical protein
MGTTHFRRGDRVRDESGSEGTVLADATALMSADDRDMLGVHVVVRFDGAGHRVHVLSSELTLVARAGDVG